MIFVHFGAGAGDQDPRSNFRCGFTEFVKKNYKFGDKVYAVDANSKNIDKLKDCYSDFIDINIINIGISAHQSGVLNFYFTEDDKPHYHVCSTNIKHVKKYYPNSKIEKFSIKTLTVNDFFEMYDLKKINYLSIDLEGIDYEVLMSINLQKYNIENISIEYLHLTKKQKRKLINHLTKNGYSYCGFGYDHQNFDFLFKKRKILCNIILSKILFLIGRKHIKFFNYFIAKQ